jgi:hypothetical protein
MPPARPGEKNKKRFSSAGQVERAYNAWPA